MTLPKEGFSVTMTIKVKSKNYKITIIQCFIEKIKKAKIFEKKIFARITTELKTWKNKIYMIWTRTDKIGEHHLKKIISNAVNFRY